MNKFFLFKFSALIFFLPLIAGCASPKKDGTPLFLPISGPCLISFPEPPVFAVDKLKGGSNIFEQMLALRVERQEKTSYIRVLTITLKACMQ